MKLISTIFSTHKVKKMFEKERYTSEEFRNFMKSGIPIQSRNNERILYSLTNGQIVIIEKKIIP